METIPTDVVTQTAAKVSLDKKFLVGVAVGAAATGVAIVGFKVKQAIKARRSTVTEDTLSN